MERISDKEIQQIIELRKNGHSLPEIKKVVKRGTGTVFRYAQGVKVDKEFQQSLREKQGGSRARAKRQIESAKERAKSLLGRIDSRDKMLVLAALYWGEGTKRELNIINGDPNLLRVFVACVQELGVPMNALQFTLRLYEDIHQETATVFWAQTLSIAAERIKITEVLKGRKKGRFKFGMCRIRLRKSGEYFKLIMAMIESIKEEIGPCSSTDQNVPVLRV